MYFGESGSSPLLVVIMKIEGECSLEVYEPCESNFLFC